MVRKERLELSRLAALEPKSSASANSATSAFFRTFQSCFDVALKINIVITSLIFITSSTVAFMVFSVHLKLGWTMGIEPTTAGITIRSSTN